MPKDQEYTGASFELARPAPEKEKQLSEESRKKDAARPVVTGSDFEASRPASTAPKEPGVVRPAKAGGGRQASQKVELSPAQRFFLARPGEGAISASKDAQKRGGREP